MRGVAANEARVAAYERTFGLGLPVLPWDTPGAARATLDAAARTRLRRFEAQVAESWLSPRPELAATEAFARLDPSSAVALYPCAPPGGPRWFAQNLHGRVDDTPLPGQDELPRIRGYDLRRRSRYAEVPVTFAPLFHVLPHTYEAFEGLLMPIGIGQQLRIVLYRNGEAALHAGFYRRPNEPAFGEAEHALLYAARPALRRWLSIASVVGIAPLGDGALVATLAATDTAALFLHRGRIVHATARAMPLVEQVRAWLGAGRPDGFATTTQLAPGGLALELVIPHVAAPVARPELPPALARIAERLARGDADKEIANELGLPLGTVRTYTTRVYERLGVHGRRELMARFPTAR